MKDLPYLSVIIPAYNEEGYINACLSSLKSQDYKGKFEIIVVDNASTDKTAKIAKKHKAKIVFCPLPGVVFARDAGVKEAKGELIVQCDADSIVPSDWLSRIAKDFAKEKKVCALFGDVSHPDAPLWTKILVSGLVRFSNILSWRFLKRPLFALASNMAFKKEEFLRIGGYNLSLPNYGDEADLLARFCKAGKVIFDKDLIVQSSARRFKGRFFEFFLIDFFYKTCFDYFLFRVIGRSLFSKRQDLRLADEKISFSAKRLFFRLVLALSLLIIVFSYAFFSPRSQVFGRVYSQFPQKDKVIALTFDDGPNGSYTQRILDILDREKVRATFFVIGRNVEYYPALTKRIVENGNVLGNHSYSHSRIAPLDANYKEEQQAEEAIFRATGLRPRFFRPPFGEKTPWMLSAIKKKGFVIFSWNDEANDPHLKNPDAIAKKIIHNARPGGIILLHDGFGTVHEGDREPTVQALPKIINTLRAYGYRFVTLDQLFKTNPYF